MFPVIALSHSLRLSTREGVGFIGGPLGPGRHGYSVLAASLFIFVLGAAHPLQTGAAGSNDGDDPDGTKKTYYWQGSQLNNLGRLGSPASFEEEQRRTREGKDADQYLASIREKLAHQAQTDTQEKNTLSFQGQLPGNPIELTYLSPGVRVTLHAEALFDENSAMLKAGAVDTLERLRTILQTQGQKPVQLVMADVIEESPQARNLDAERSLLVLTILANSEAETPQENLPPEALTQ